MVNLPHYAAALRCIGQALQSKQIEVFEVKCRADEFQVLAGDPNPPYTALIELNISGDNIKIRDRAGQAQRRRSITDVRFDSVPEILRAVGEYIDHKPALLRRLSNDCSASGEEPAIEIEYQTRAGDVRTETLPLTVLHERSVHMYKRRTRLASPINILTRRRSGG